MGASGYFGSLLVEDLLRHTDANVWVGARGRGGMEKLLRRFGPGLSQRLTPCVCDLAQPASVEAVLPQVDVAVCAAGPYQHLPLTLRESCVKHGVPYIDLADDRGFFVKARDWVARWDGARVPALCIGWSAVPALSGLLARMVVEDLDRVDALFVQIAPGNRAPRNKGTVSSLLASLGQPCRLWREGEWREVPGWTEPRTFPFPLPVGPRRGYLVDVPDHEIFPALFHARRVEFRVGAELVIFNHGASALAWLSRRLAIQWHPWAGWLAPAMGVLGFLGHDWGAVGVEVSGVQAGLPVRRQACVVAGSSGQRIPVMPAAVMAARLLSGGAAEGGHPRRSVAEPRRPRIGMRQARSRSNGTGPAVKDRLWTRLRRAAWLAFAVHLLAGLAMALILRHGLETNADLAGRLRFVAQHRFWWTAGWLSWTVAAVTILTLYARFAAAHRSRGVSSAPLRTAVLLTIVAVAADWTAQAVEMFVLPGLARMANAAGFLVWHRAAVVLTGFLANGLYSMSALLLVWASRRAYPRWIQVAGFGVVAGGSILSAAAWADSAAGMLVANVVLVPCLLVWLAGVATSASLYAGSHSEVVGERR